MSDSWHSKPVDYYVELVRRHRAGRIRPPEMPDFFSKLGVEYPWEKYAQIAVRDYVSRDHGKHHGLHLWRFRCKAPAAIYSMLPDQRVRHRAKLSAVVRRRCVTCESWANAAERVVADYSEFLWAEHSTVRTGLVRKSKSIITSKKPIASASRSSVTAT
jgi:aminopeptidase N